MLARLLSALMAVTFLLMPACSRGPMQTGTGPAAVAADRRPGDYHLGSGDKLRIIVFGEESLTGEYFVSGAGTVAFPLVGEIPARGKTLPELQDAIQAKLSEGYLRAPRVSAEVLNYRPFYILGEVNKPGEYPYTAGLTVLNAVATAQGFTYRADTRHIYIKRAETSAEEAYDLTTTTPVEPGDTIRIRERMF